MKNKILLISTILSSLGMVKPVFGQVDQTELIRSVLTIFLGQLPGACSADFGDPTCVECIGFLKFLPLMFFIGLFYLVFYLIVRNLGGVAQRQTERGPVQERVAGSTELRIAAVLAIVLAIVFMHTPQVQGAIKSVLVWLSLAFVFLAVMLIAGVGRGMPNIVIIIISLIIIGALWGYFFGTFSGVVENYQNICG